MNKPMLFQCPECGAEIEVAQFGVSHIAGIGCIKCGVNMERAEIDDLQHLTDEEKKEAKERDEK